MFDSLASQRARVFGALFQGYEGPVFSMRMWDGWQWASSTAEKPVCTIVLQTPKTLESLVAEPSEITLGEAFIHRELEIEGDIFSVFPVAEHIFNRPRRLRQQLFEKISRTLFSFARWVKQGSCHSLRRDRSAISQHYDQPVEFFQPWLGESLAYSCAYFHTPDDPLHKAQEQKLELICNKLRLRPLDHFLDIGCGWGSLILHAATKHRVHAHGITLSQEQATVAKRRIKQANLEQCCAAELRDYRESADLLDSFDKIASVGMFEHVGMKNLSQYFRTVRQLLRPGGVFLNHGITCSCSSPKRKESFIDRYVFPDGELVTLSQALKTAEAEGLEVRDVENLREHYEITLRRWVDGLLRNADTLRKYVSEDTYRIWLLYMAGSAASFCRGDIAVHQVLLSRPNRGNSQLPLTRKDWYSISVSEQQIKA